MAVPDDEPVLMTRLDDDDGLAPDAIERIQRAAEGLTERTILMLPEGYRVSDGKQQAVRHPTNAMQTLFTPPGDRLSVYDYGHHECGNIAPVVMVDDRPGWLWVRHRDTISQDRTASEPISDAVRKLFPIDWAALERAWAA
jgi:hypothetical protein